MKYKIGDKVKINNLPTSPEGKDMWITDMDKYIGKVVTIKEMDIEWFRFNENGYYFPLCSIKPVLTVNLPEHLFRI